MSHGGPRVGAGRPKRAKAAPEPRPEPEKPKRSASARRLNPLDYMLEVMNDLSAEDARRDRMAVAAAPYLHAKAEAVKLGKKEEADEAARTAESGTDWEGLLN